MSRAALRRSAGLPALPVLLAVVVGHIAFRDRTWTHEWLWAVYQFGFVTILVGPLLAGLAAWEGWRLANAADLLATARRPRRAATVTWAVTYCWGLVAFSAGLLAVGLLVRLAGTPGWPPAAAVGAVFPAVALLAAETAVGLLAGWWLRHPLAAPSAAVGCFLFSLWLYVSGPSGLIVVGGATGSLVGLAPRPQLEAAQVLYFVAVALLAVLLVARPRPWSGTPRTRVEALPTYTSGVVLVAALALVLSRGETTLAPVSDPLTCVGSKPTICVSGGYVRYAASTRAALLPYLARLAATGVPVPSRFEQDAEHGELTIGPIDSALLLGSVDQAGFSVLHAYLSKKCPIFQDTKLQQEWNGLVSWLYAGSVPVSTDDATIPDIVRGPRTPAQLAWVKAAVTDLGTCGH